MIHPFGTHQPTLAEGAFVAPSADVIGRVSLGRDASVFFQCVLRADINFISVGDRTNIQDQTTVHVASDLGTVIGNDVSIGHGCVIHACTLKDRILVGMGAIVMDGAVVGDDCLIAAGSLLPKGRQYPAGSLILGNPGKVIRPLNPEEIDSLAKLAAKYVKVKDAYLGRTPWPG